MLTKPAGARRLGPNASGGLGPLREQVRDIIQAIDEDDQIELVALSEALLHEVEFVAGVEAGLGEQMDFPFRMSAAQAVGEAVGNV